MNVNKCIQIYSNTQSEENILAYLARCLRLTRYNTYADYKGEYTQDGWIPGTGVSFTCLNGYYKLSGTVTRICQSDGKWNGEDVVCVIGNNNYTSCRRVSMRTVQ